MKKFSLLVLMFFVSACAHGPIFGDEDCTYRRAPRKEQHVQEPRPQPVQIVQVAQPQPAPCYQPQPVVVQQPQPCNGCRPTVRETREPVEIVYKKVIYTTTYEPKTTQNVVYEREPVKNAEVKVVQQPVPTVSKVIETQVTQEPVKISVEEVK